MLFLLSFSVNLTSRMAGISRNRKKKPVLKCTLIGDVVALPI